MLFAIFNTEMEMNEWTLMSLKEKDIETASSSSLSINTFTLAPRRGRHHVITLRPRVWWGGGLQIALLPSPSPSLSLSLENIYIILKLFKGFEMRIVPLEICTLINNPEKFHILQNPLCVRIHASLPLLLPQPSSVIYSSCEMSHFAALGLPQDISNHFFKLSK